MMTCASARLLHCPNSAPPSPHPPQEFPNVLTLRVRMPIVADLVYPRNFITKIIK